MRECRKYKFYGRVQGVGFRATARRLAAGFDVSGTVQNLSDGSVLVNVCGEPEEMKRFVAAIETTFGDAIDRVEQEPLYNAPDFQGFRIIT